MKRLLEGLTASDYASALQSLQLTDTRVAMLKAHYRSPGRALSARQMGQRLGWDMPSTANMHYGRLGGAIADQLRVNGAGRVHTMVTFIAPVDSASREALWVMRPQLAKALERLQLVKPRKAGKARVKAYVSHTGDPIASAFEGAKRVAWRSQRHREWQLRQAKIAEVLARTGRLQCEVPRCGFDFEAAYGELGQGFAEVHHTRSLGRRPGDRATTLSELVIVCANCHAMIHRGGTSRALTDLKKRR